MSKGLEELDGRVAVITGGAAGIGLAFAEAFAAEGMKIVIADIDVAGHRAVWRRASVMQ